ncbi:MAG: dienelactone hydrolase family protein [Deferribacterales bacterium]
MRFFLTLAVMLAASVAMAGQAVVYQSAGKDYEGYYAPVKGAPLVLIIHDWDGLTDYEVKRADMLNELGFSAFALDMYGKGVRPTEIAENKRLTAELYNDREKMRRLLNAGVAAAKEQGADVSNAVMIGYCFGGAVALEYARSGEPLKAFIPFHGGLSTPDGQDYSKTNGEVVVFHGTADKAVSMAEFAALAVELEQAGIKHEMHTYSGAPHAFTVFGSPRYHEEADKKSWSRFVEYINTKLK